MRYLILSDLHGNWEALEAITREAGEFDTVLCCGDVVGYGADPNRVCEWVREHAAITIRGNHDRACSTLEQIEWFNPLAQAATVWTHDELSEDNLKWLVSLPQGPAVIEDFRLVHGSPLHEDEYLLTLSEVECAFAYVEAALTFFGHTHVQGAFQFRRRVAVPVRDVKAPIEIEEDSAYLVNCGSAGQPRDGDPRAAYGMYDSGARVASLHRVAYDVEAAQRKILEAGLPEQLAHRLALGR